MRKLFTEYSNYIYAMLVMWTIVMIYLALLGTRHSSGIVVDQGRS